MASQLGLILTSAMLLPTVALNIKRKAVDPVTYAAVPSGGSDGHTATVSFSRNDKTIFSAPIYDISDEPFQNIEFSKKFDTGAEFDGESEEEKGAKEDAYPTGRASGGTDGKKKAANQAIEMKKCTPEASLELAQKYPVEKIPIGFPQKSALPARSFYAKQVAQHSQATYGCSDEGCQLPTYIALREENKTLQKIPRIIWMTTSDQMLAGKAGPFQYNLMAEHWTKNPEYEMVISGDAMSAAFMESDEVKPEWGAAYKAARNGAEKADIWRYAVMYKYGGVYMDSDMKLSAPYNTFVDVEADVVQQATVKSFEAGSYEMSQFALLFVPKHPLMLDMLTSIAAKFSGGVPTMLTILLTGPGAMAVTYMKYAPCGMSKMHDTDKKVFGKKMSESCVHPELGKVTMLMKERDFNTAQKWHKADVCALAESRTLFSHWAQAGAAAGGRAKWSPSDIAAKGEKKKGTKK